MLGPTALRWPAQILGVALLSLIMMGCGSTATSGDGAALAVTPAAGTIQPDAAPEALPPTALPPLPARTPALPPDLAGVVSTTTVLGGSAEVATLTVQELKALLEGPNKPPVFDARAKVSYEAGHLPGAVSLSFDELDARLAEIPRNRLSVFYCSGRT
jgi:hypothetical protein